MRENILHSLVMAALMSLFMSGIVTVVNTGIDAEIVPRWMRALYITFPAAFLALLILKPVASLITCTLVRIGIDPQ